MSISANEKARVLQKEAKSLLENEPFWEPFQQGIIHPAGSYYLDLLACPDLDVYFDLTSSKNNIEAIFASAAQFFEWQCRCEMLLGTKSKS